MPIPEYLKAEGTCLFSQSSYSPGSLAQVLFTYEQSWPQVIPVGDN